MIRRIRQGLSEVLYIVTGFIGMLGLLLWAIFILDALGVLRIWERL